MWRISFYEKENGRCPVRDFLDGLNPKNDLPFIARAVERLKEFGYRLDRPHVGYLRDDIYELRVKTVDRQIRIFYFFL